jgi:hypothetical protein
VGNSFNHNPQHLAHKDVTRLIELSWTLALIMLSNDAGWVVMLKRHAKTNNYISTKNMNSCKSFVIVGSLLTSALLSLNVQAQLSYNVSAGSNPTGVFSYLVQPPWTSGDISLPGGTTIGTTPLQIDLTLSGNVTLDNPTGIEDYGWALNYDSPIAPGADFGTVDMELLENGTVITPLFGFDLTQPFPIPEANIGTGEGATLPVNAVFNGVDIFVSNPGNPGVVLNDIEVGLPSVPDTSSTMLLLSLGVVAMSGFGHRKVISFRSQP